MRILTLFLFTLLLASCQQSESEQTPATPPASPETVATNFINAFFEQNDIQATAAFATGELKEKILNTSDAELSQLKMISTFEISDIKTETKLDTNLSVVSLKTKMVLNGNELMGNQNIVLKLIDNQWMVYHF